MEQRILEYPEKTLGKLKKMSITNMQEFMVWMRSESAMIAGWESWCEPLSHVSLQASIHSLRSPIGWTRTITLKFKRPKPSFELAVRGCMNQNTYLFSALLLAWCSLAPFGQSYNNNNSKKSGASSKPLVDPGAMPVIPDGQESSVCSLSAFLSLLFANSRCCLQTRSPSLPLSPFFSLFLCLSLLWNQHCWCDVYDWFVCVCVCVCVS